MAKKSPTPSPRRGVTAPQGFLAAGIHCGIKKPGLLDLALIVSEQSGPIAGVFTKNQVVAAPVIRRSSASAPGNRPSHSRQ